MQTDFLRFLIFAFPIGLCGCGSSMGTRPSGQAQMLDTIQPGDRQLNCQQLSDQINQVNKLMYQSDPNGDMTNLAGTGAATMASSALSFIPVVGPYIGSGASLVSSSSMTNSIQQSADQRSMAQERKQHLLNLYNNKKC